MKTDVVTKKHREDVFAVLETSDPGILEAALAEGSSWRERAKLVSLARKAAPDLTATRVCEVVGEWFDGRTGGRESERRKRMGRAERREKVEPYNPEEVRR